MDLFRLLVGLGIRMRTLMDQRLAGIGLTTQQAAVLTVVEQLGTPTITQVSQALGTTHQNTRQIVEALQRKNFLDVAIDPADRRARRLSVTAFVRDTFDPREAEDRTAVHRWTGALTDDECATLVRLLNSLQG